jgi:hypothetical protein
VVTAEILMASESGCPLEVHKIAIDKCDEMYDDECKGDTWMPFYRAKYDSVTGQSPNSPREQVNLANITWGRREKPNKLNCVKTKGAIPPFS